MAGPLTGIKVVEFSEIIAGPISGVLLSDLGAEVVKVEPPWGDPWRGAPSRVAENESVGFIAVNRGKRSIRLDMTTAAGREVAHRLVAAADVVVVNHRPDVPAKLGFDYETLSGVNPRIVYCEVSAFGRKGPHRDGPGYDIILQAMSGIMASEGIIDEGVPRVLGATPLVDFATGYAIAGTVSAALYHRERTGKGQKIETSLLANALHIQALSLTRVEGTPSPTQQWLKDDLPLLKDAGLRYEEINALYQQNRRLRAFRTYYRTYQTADWVIALGCLSEPLRKRAADVMEIRDIRFDPGYAPCAPESIAFAEELSRKPEALMLEKPADEWLDLFRAVGVPASRVYFVDEMMSHEQVVANEMIVTQEHPVAGTVRSAGPVAKMSDSPLEAVLPSPGLGQHTRELLLELGYSDAEADEMKASGAAT